MASQLKIGITCYPTFGGSGIVATELGLALAGLGCEVHFISSRVPARLQGRALADVSFHEVNTYSYALFQHEPYTLALAAKMAEVAETFELDVLHVHYAIPHAISAHLAQEMLSGAVKVVTTLHGTDITLVGNDPSLHKITAYAIEQADAVTAVSNWLREETVKEFSPGIPIAVIPNFINTNEYHPGLDKHWAGSKHCDQTNPSLVHVSNFRPVKRAPDAVDVFSRVLQNVDASLVMVGDGPDLHRAVNRAKELGVMDKISFLGNREDIAHILAASDILLMPSESESFGLAALEAMACGCTVAASRIGGVPELVVDGETGMLFDVGDTAAMAEGVTSLISSKARLRDMKENARQRAVREFESSVVVQRYLETYSGVMTGRGAAGG